MLSANTKARGIPGAGGRGRDEVAPGVRHNECMGTAHSVTTSRVRIVTENGGVRFFSRVSGVELSFEGDAPYLWGAASELGIPYEEMHATALLSELHKAAVRGGAYTYESDPAHLIRRPDEREKAQAKRWRAQQRASHDKVEAELRELRRRAKVGERQYLLSPTEHPDVWVQVRATGEISFGPGIRIDRIASNLVLPQGVDAAAALPRWQAIVDASQPLRMFDAALIEA